jgi:hypothetical protein
VSQVDRLRGEGRWEEAPTLVDDPMARALAEETGSTAFLRRIDAALAGLR